MTAINSPEKKTNQLEINKRNLYKNDNNVNENNRKSHRRQLLSRKQVTLCTNDENNTCNNHIDKVRKDYIKNRRLMIKTRRDTHFQTTSVHQDPVVTTNITSYPGGGDYGRTAYQDHLNNDNRVIHTTYGSIDEVKNTKDAVFEGISNKCDDDNIGKCMTFKTLHDLQEVTDSESYISRNSNMNKIHRMKRNSKSSNRENMKQYNTDHVSGYPMDSECNSDPKIGKYYYDMYCASINDTNSVTESDTSSDTENDIDVYEEMDLNTVTDTNIDTEIDTEFNTNTINDDIKHDFDIDSTYIGYDTCITSLDFLDTLDNSNTTNSDSDTSNGTGTNTDTDTGSESSNTLFY